MHVVDGSPLPEPDEGDGPTAEQLELVAHRHGGSEGELDVSEQRYEVMYFLDLADERIDGFKQGWGEIGDSIVVVGGDGLWNCHVHTNDIGAAIEVALDLDGRPRHDPRHRPVRRGRRRARRARGAGIAQPRRRRPPPGDDGGRRRVLSGDGLAELFANLRVQGIVSGGQTLNPSTAELLDTVEHVNAEQVVILPNNKNIIPVAEQVDALDEQDRAGRADAHDARGAGGADRVRPGGHRRAERGGDGPGDRERRHRRGHAGDARPSSDAGPIATGDWIGIVRGDGIVTVGDSLDVASTALLDQLLDERSRAADDHHRR